MNTKENRRKPAAKVRRSAAGPAPDADRRRRKTGAPNTPDREERQRRIQKRRKAKAQNPPKRQRVIRPPREEIPKVVYTAPRPLRRGRFLWKLVSMAAVVAAIFLGLSVFFRVETITVAGADKYSPWMIRQAAGIAPGDPLLGIGEARVASRIISDLPYVNEVKVGIRLPGTVEIQVTELQVTYSIADETGSWWLISSEGRAVEKVTEEKAMGYTRAEGIAIRTPEQGQQVKAMPGQIVDPGDGSTIDQEQSEADEQLRALIEVMGALEDCRIIGEVAKIDVTDVTNIRLEYPQLLTVLLGNTERIGYKVNYLASAVQQLAGNQSGELDVSFEYAEDAVFTPKR
jgi:cell division septal protein FtsQ